MSTGVLTGTEMVKKKFIEKRIKELTDGYKVTDAIFKRAGSDTPSIVYEENPNGLLDNEDSAEVEERTESGQYPRIGITAEEKQALIKDYGLSVLVTYEAIRFNRISSIDRAYMRLGNSLIKFVDEKGFGKILANANIHSQAAGTAWATSTNIVGDIILAKAKINGSGYMANTLLMDPDDVAAAMANKDFRAELDKDVPAERKIVKAGLIVGQIAGLTLIEARTGVKGNPMVLQDQILGDRQETSNGVQIDAYKANNSQKADTIIDGFREFEDVVTDPKAVCKITGV